MFRSTNTMLSLVLIWATSLGAVEPMINTCQTKGCEESSEHCGKACCERPNEGQHACCSDGSQQEVCQCSANQERPATPQERRTSDERTQARQLECPVALLFLGEDKLLALFAQDASLLSSLPTPHRQALLCCWLI